MRFSWLLMALLVIGSFGIVHADEGESDVPPFYYVGGILTPLTIGQDLANPIPLCTDELGNLLDCGLVWGTPICDCADDVDPWIFVE